MAQGNHSRARDEVARGRHSPPYLVLADNIARDLDASHDPHIPSMRDLARHYGVSRNTVARAVAHLRDGGVLCYGRGQRPRRPLPATSLPSEPPSSAAALERLLADIIERGVLRRGAVLGKVAALAHEHRVSTSTVVRALASLADRGLVHKSRRAWVAGPTPSRPRILRHDNGPVILVLTDRATAWRGLAESERTSRFCHALNTEAEASGVRLTSVFTGEQPVPEVVAAVGRDSVRATIRMLGERYRGTLVATTGPAIADTSGWIDTLLRHRRPVVWFDHHDLPLDPPIRSPLFTRCHFSESAMAEACVSRLHESGHRHLLFPIANEPENRWKRLRFDLIARAGKSRGMTATAVAIPFTRPAPGQDHIGWWWGQAREGLLAGLAANPRTTAVIAPRDSEAYHYLQWFTQAGIRVPRDLSMLSFDNRPYLQTFPLSTVDSGMGSLGYASLHLLLGDVPVRRQRNGDVPARAFVVDRGSVGPPRKGAPRLS